MVDMKVLASCQVCEGAVVRYRHEWLRRCSVCGVLSADLPISIPDIAGPTALDETLRAQGLESVRAKNNAKLVAELRHLAPGVGRVLDVGCGPGFLLALASAAGFDVVGIEPDVSVGPGVSRMDGEVLWGYFPQVLDPDDVFDVIVFNDVLEHIPDLTGALTASLQHLRQGGVLCLNCPDQRGLFFRTASLLDRIGVSGPYDRLWQRGLPSPHVWYFTPELLQSAARRAGFEPISMLRLETVTLSGLWARIRYAKTPLWMAIATYLFTVITYPAARLLPPDASAGFYRRP